VNQESQQAEFPKEFVDLLHCCSDKALRVSDAVCNISGNILSARLTCDDCKAEYSIVDGIARFLPQALAEEDQFEMRVRDEQYSEDVDFSPCSRSPLSDHIELPPFLRQLDIDDRSVVLEIGSGDGRFTLLMCQQGARVLAVDISLNGLRLLNQRLGTGKAPTPFPQDGANIRNFRGRVGLVHADASKVRLASRSINRALSTTPLDSAEQRLALYRTIADALTDDGWFVGSVEYDDIWRRNLGLPVHRRYAEGIFIEHFSKEKVAMETMPYFKTLHTWPIRPRVPLVHRIPLNTGIWLCNLLTSVPVLRDMGEILLFRASKPIRPGDADAHRPGSHWVKLLFRWYTKLANKEYNWHGEPL
jgi:SAM-dependent methyltransferase